MLLKLVKHVSYFIVNINYIMLLYTVLHNNLNLHIKNKLITNEAYMLLNNMSAFCAHVHCTLYSI